MQPASPAAASAIVAPPLPPSPLPLDELFASAGPLEVDVGCGKGRFLLAQAAAHPERRFLGIDKRRKRIEKVDRKLRRAGLANVRLLLAEAAGAVEHWLPPAAVTTFYVFFPDPWPKRRHQRRRLFSPAFLDAVYRTLVPGGRLYFATDDAAYFAAVRALFAAQPRFGETAPYEPVDAERTEFETTFTRLGKPIHRGGFVKLPAPAPNAPPPPRSPSPDHRA